MAVVELNKLRLVGLNSERDKVMDTLSKSGVFEVCPTTEIDIGSARSDNTHLDRVIGKQVKVSFAVDYILALDAEAAAHNARAARLISRGREAVLLDYAPVKRDGGTRRVVSYDDFYDGAAKEYELLSVAEALEKSSFKRVEYRSAIARLIARRRSLLPYRYLPFKFSEMKDTLKTSRFLVYADAATANLERLNLAEFPVYTENYKTDKGVLAAVIVLKRNKESALKILSDAGFSVVSFSDDETAQRLIEADEQEIERLKRADFEELRSALNYAKYLPDFQILYDYLGLEVEKSQAETNFVKTSSTFVAEGWIPSSASQIVIDKIKEQTERVDAFLYEPKEGDNPPTLLKNSKVIEPFEEITNLYSAPLYTELDPNPFMAVFFFIFYGFMMADAGYGLIMSLAAFIVLRLKTFEKGTKRLIALIGICGVSTLFWGVLFGGLFGIEGVPPLWFNPLEEPMMMFGLSLVLGVIQILFGYGLYAVKMFRKKQYFAGIIDVIFKFTIIIGAGLVLLNILFSMSAALLTAGIAVIIASLVGIVLTAGHANKGVLSKITGGFAGLYDLVNLLSDILSYARLFGLALASSAIALAFNTLGSLFFGIGAVGYIIGIIVLIPLHVFNLGLGLLSGYVHNSRLQFIEFYNKFYEGGGRIFSPMGEKTRFIKLSASPVAKSGKRVKQAGGNRV